MLSKMLT